MKQLSHRFQLGSLKNKVAAGFLLALVAMSLALGITHLAFKQLLGTVDELAAPNEKLEVLNDLFESITSLDQLQRAEAIKDPKAQLYEFQGQSHDLNALIDSLIRMKWDSAQRDRLHFLKEILGKRDNLFFAYLRLKATADAQKDHDERLDTLSTIIERSRVDTAIVSTQKKTVTTTLRDTITGTPTKDDRKFIGKLFGKKKTDQPVESHVRVQQEFSVTVDTVAFEKHNTALIEIERILQNIELDQRARTEALEHQELQLIHANSLFVGDLQRMVREVENEELLRMRENNTKASTLFTQSVTIITILIVVFSLLAAFLIYFIWVDISKSNYYKAQLEKARDEAEELSRTKQRFLANMSHEIRTPLQSIIGFAEQLQHHPQKGKEAANAIYHSSEHLLHIVNEVLDYSRITSGNFVLQTTPFQLQEVINEVTNALRVQADKKQIDFLFTHNISKPVYLEGDAFRLKQILYNLLGNAIKFTSKGYVQLHVSMEESDQFVQTVFEISDTGVGIEQEDLERIFNQFEQVIPASQQPEVGTGLGLSIVKALVELQQGNLQVSSTPGIGSVFTVSLQYPKSDVLEKIESTAYEDRNHAACHVLVVDDDATILSLCSLILSKYRIEHTIHHDATQLLDAPPLESVTHILLDIRMPNISGVELCKVLRKKYPSHVSFIALTAHVFPQEQELLLKEGFDSVLSKPFREAELLNILGVSQQRIVPENIHKRQRTFNPEIVRNMTMGDEQLYDSVIDQFLSETTSDLLLFDDLLSQMNTSGLREVVHKLAGRIGQLGINTLSLRLRNLEDQLERGTNFSSLIERLISVRDDVTLLVTEVKQSRVKESNKISG